MSARSLVNSIEVVCLAKRKFKLVNHRFRRYSSMFSPSVPPLKIYDHVLAKNKHKLLTVILLMHSPYILGLVLEFWSLILSMTNLVYMVNGGYKIPENFSLLNSYRHCSAYEHGHSVEIVFMICLLFVIFLSDCNRIE